MGFIGGNASYTYICLHMYLLETELGISGFQHFDWLTGHRLSVHIRTVSNMVKEFCQQ